MKSYLKLYFALAMAGGAVVATNETAAAMDVSGVCRTSEEISIGMRSDGYVPVVVANYADGNTGRFFYLNTKDNTAYLVFSDKPLGTKATCLRVQSKWSQAELYDVTKVNRPSQVNWPRDAAYAGKACAAFEKTRCGFYDDRIELAAKSGMSVYMRGVTPYQTADGKISGDMLLTVVGTTDAGDKPLADLSGKIMATVPTGMTFDAFDYSYIAYTKEGTNILNDRLKLIETSPNLIKPKDGR